MSITLHSLPADDGSTRTLDCGALLQLLYLESSSTLLLQDLNLTGKWGAAANGSCKWQRLHLRLWDGAAARGTFVGRHYC